MDPISTIVGGITSIIDKIFPDANERERAKARLAELQISGELQAAADEIRLRLAQIEVNKADAQSGKWWQAGWRPAVGWIGAFSLGYAAIIEPLARFVATVVFGYSGAFPVLDSTLTMQVLFGLLGFGAYRTVERVKGKA